jgi:hypothetical protein
MSKTNSIILIDKFGKLKTLQVNIKDFNKNDLYKKCGFKNNLNFSKQNVWKVIIDKHKYAVSVYAKTDGRANMENKYDFPPPIDNNLFFGTCAIVCEIQDLQDNSYKLTDLSISLWDKIYEKLFGGFENLNDMAIEDENEEDELANVKSDKKTKQGYLKDGFVVDDKSDDDDENDDEEEDDDEDDEDVDDVDDIDDEESEEIDDEIEEDIDIDDDIDDEEDDEEEDEEDEDGNIIKKKYKSKKNKKTNAKVNSKNKAVASTSKSSKKGKSNKKNIDIIEDLVLEDLTTELSEEEYDYNDK